MSHNHVINAVSHFKNGKSDGYESLFSDHFLHINDEGAHCVNMGCVALTLIKKFGVIQQLERFRFFNSGYMNRQGTK